MSWKHTEALQTGVRTVFSCSVNAAVVNQSAESICVWTIPQKALFITHHTESNRPSSQTHRQKQVHYFHLNRLVSRRSGLSDCECVWGFTVFRFVRISSVFCCETQSITLVNSLRGGISILLFSLSLWPLRLRLHLSLRSCRKRLKN